MADATRGPPARGDERPSPPPRRKRGCLGNLLRLLVVAGILAGLVVAGLRYGGTRRALGDLPLTARPPLLLDLEASGEGGAVFRTAGTDPSRTRVLVTLGKPTGEPDGAWEELEPGAFPATEPGGEPLPTERWRKVFSPVLVVHVEFPAGDLDGAWLRDSLQARDPSAPADMD